MLISRKKIQYFVYANKANSDQNAWTHTVGCFVYFVFNSYHRLSVYFANYPYFANSSYEFKNILEACDTPTKIKIADSVQSSVFMTSNET